LLTLETSQVLSARLRNTSSSVSLLPFRSKADLSLQLLHVALEKWWQQAKEQADKVKKSPALAYRLDRCKWSVVLPAYIFLPAATGERVTVSLELFAVVVRESIDGQ